MKKHITIMTTHLIGVLLNYARQLEVRPFHKYNPSAEHKLISDSVISDVNYQCRTSNIPEMQKSSKTIVSEKLIYERQMIAVIALLCGQHSCILDSLLHDIIDTDLITNAEGEQDENLKTENQHESFMNCLVKILRLIGYAVKNI